MAAPTTLTTINGGINRLRTKGGADKNSLFDLLNGYVTSTGTVKVRNGTKRNANIAQYSGAGKTKGLVAYQDQFHVFSAEAVDVPPNYALHVLNHPAATQFTQPDESVTATITPAINPDTANVALLLLFDNANNATTTQDSSFNNYVPIFESSPGGTKISSTAPENGIGCLSIPICAGLNNGKGFYVPLGAGSPADVFTQSLFTIEFSIKIPSGTDNALLQMGGNFPGGGLDSVFWLSMNCDGTNTAFTVQTNEYGQGNPSVTISGSVVSGYGNWLQVALVKYSDAINDCYLFVNGVPIITTFKMDKAAYSGGSNRAIVLNDSANINSTFGACFYDNFRVTSGIARYAKTGYTPSSDGFPAPSFPFNWGYAGYGYANPAAAPAAELVSVGASTVTDINGATLVAAGVTTGVGYTTPASPVVTIALAGTAPQNYFVSVIITPSGGTPQTLNALDADFNLSLPGGGAPTGASTWTWPVANAADFFSSSGTTTVEFIGPGAPVATIIPIKEIHFSAPYLGGLYVVAEFDVDSTVLAQYGDTYHYWVQSSTNRDSSNAWQADHEYLIGDVIIPTTPNGFTYIATRRDPANPTWTPNTAETVGNVIEPTIYNGFKFTATATAGANPTTGSTEPTWPTSDGAIVNENSLLASDQTITLAQPAPTTPTPTVPSRYSGGIAGGFSTTTGGA